MSKPIVKPIAEQVLELFRMVQSGKQNDIFLDFALSDTAHKEGNQNPDNWRFQPEVLTYILYIFCPHEATIGRLLAPSNHPGISQPAVSKRLLKAIDIIAERHGCPTHALEQELIDAKRRIIHLNEIKNLRTPYQFGGSI